MTTQESVQELLLLFAEKRVVSMRGNEIPNILTKYPGFENVPLKSIDKLTHDITDKTPFEVYRVTLKIMKLLEDLDGWAEVKVLLAESAF